MSDDGSATALITTNTAEATHATTAKPTTDEMAPDTLPDGVSPTSYPSNKTDLSSSTQGRGDQPPTADQVGNVSSSTTASPIYDLTEPEEFTTIISLDLPQSTSGDDTGSVTPPLLVEGRSEDPELRVITTGAEELTDFYDPSTPTSSPSSVYSSMVPSVSSDISWTLKTVDETYTVYNISLPEGDLVTFPPDSSFDFLTNPPGSDEDMTEEDEGFDYNDSSTPIDSLTNITAGTGPELSTIHATSTTVPTTTSSSSSCPMDLCLNGGTCVWTPEGWQVILSGQICLRIMYSYFGYFHEYFYYSVAVCGSTTEGAAKRTRNCSRLSSTERRI